MKCKQCGGPVVELFTSVVCAVGCADAPTYGYGVVPIEMVPWDIESFSSTPHGRVMTVFAELGEAVAVRDSVKRRRNLQYRVARLRVAPGQVQPGCEDEYAGITFRTYPMDIVLRYTFDCFLEE